MQLLARDGHTADQVARLLRGHVEVDFGCDLLAPSLAVVEDISGDLDGGSIARGMFKTIHGTCNLRLTRDLAWGVDLVRPYMILANDEVEVRANCGVYMLETPGREMGEEPATRDSDGADRLRLLSRETRDDYVAAGGISYRDALLDVFAAAGLTGVLIDGAAADNELPRERVWPLVAHSADPDETREPVTYLRIVNDLLRAIHFRGVWADENGVFRCHAYREPAVRAPEFMFDADDPTMRNFGEARREVVDVWDIPNVWVFRQTNRPDGAPSPSESDGIYTVELDVLDPAHPMTTANRGLEWVRNVDYEAASQAKLVALGDARVAADLRVATRYEVTTGPFPFAGHFDVFRYRDAAVGDHKVQAVEWSFDLDGSDVEWVWEAVV